MISMLQRHWIFILLFLVISIFYLLGIPAVPFHPDESTFLFMSAEFERIISNPLELAWDNSGNPTPIMRYRMIDAPITRYLIGIGLSLANLPSLETDWDWSASWQDNQISGALPNSFLLLIGRLTVASLFPLSLILIYLIALKLDGRLLGVVIVIIFCSNPLILLHTRRAMAEGTLIFAVLLALYAILHGDKYPFLAGFAVAVAFNAKHSAGLLLPIGLLAVCWTSSPASRRYSRMLSNIARYMVGFGLLTLFFNPFLWRNPISAVQEALFYRQELIERQVADFERFAPFQVLDSPGQRVAIAIAQVFIAPPVFSEAGNYAADTRIAENSYMKSIGSQLGRQPVIAGFLIGFTILGWIATLRNITSAEFAARRYASIIMLSFIGFSAGIIVLIPLAWQRYYLPLIPFMAIFAGLGIIWGIKTSRSIFAHGRLSSRLSQILTQFTPNSWMS